MSMAILGTVLSTASSVMSGMAQQQAAEAQAQAQADYQARLAIQQRDQNYEEQVALQKEQTQKSEQIQREKLIAQQKARREISAAKAAAAGSGVSGVSVDALLSDYAMQHSMNLAALNRQAQLTQEASSINIHNVATDTYTPAPVEHPSTGAFIAETALGVISNLL